MTAKPHILILMTDQHRADCLGCAGHPQLRTPNLDRLAREGARFTQATTVSPLCMPARASFATGLYPHDHGMWRNSGALDLGNETLFQLLKKAGYFTAVVGKAHYYEHEPGTDLRDREDFMHALGFSYVHETAGQLASLRTASYLTDEWRRRGLWDAIQADYADRAKDQDQVVRRSVLPVDDVLDSYVGRKAVDFVDAYEAAHPLCLFVGFPGPHNPWDAPGSYASMYPPEDTPPPIPIPSLPATLPEYVEPGAPFRHGPSLSPAVIAEIRANYYGKITLIDHHVGRILEAFERKGLLHDLLVIFMADHGEMLGDHGRIRKGLFYEPSLRIPLLMRWPGRIPAGLVTDALVENIDVFPTILEAAGVSAAAWHAGHSLWPVLRGETTTLRHSQLCESGRTLNHFMLRTPEYKLSVDDRYRPYLLFDLVDDPDEQRNRVGDPAAAALQARSRDELEHRLQRSSRGIKSSAAPAERVSGSGAALAPRGDRGFTLIELTVAIVLLALIASVLYGSLSLAGDSWNKGEARAQRTSEMRSSQDFLRRTLTSQHPLRFHKVTPDQPLYFLGTRDSLAYAAALPGRVGGGMYYFRLSVASDGDNPQLTLARMIPDYSATALPSFDGADVSVLAPGIGEVRFGYFGRDPGSADSVPPTWRDRWDDQQRLPDLIRVDVTPSRGTPWPTLVVEPRLAPEAGCPSWNPAQRRCM